MRAGTQVGWLALGLGAWHSDHRGRRYCRRVSDDALINSLLRAVAASPDDVALLHVDPDAEIAVGARADVTPESAIRIALRTSSGKGVASLSGTYAFVAVHLEYDAFGLASSVAEGTGVFDGLGGATFTGQEETISSTGVAQLGPIGGSLVYAVAPDGALSFGPTESGGISPNVINDRTRAPGMSDHAPSTARPWPSVRA